MNQRLLSLFLLLLSLPLGRLPAEVEDGPGFSGKIIHRFDISNPYEERISSPSIAIVPIGTDLKAYVATCDKTLAKGHNITWIFQSKDGGETWKQVSVLAPEGVMDKMENYEPGENTRSQDGVWTSGGASVQVQTGTSGPWTPVAGEPDLEQVPIMFAYTGSSYTFKIPRTGWGSGTGTNAILQFSPVQGGEDDDEEEETPATTEAPVLFTTFTATSPQSPVTASYYWQGKTRRRVFTRLDIAAPPLSQEFVDSQPSPTRLNAPSGVAKYVPPATTPPDLAQNAPMNYSGANDAVILPPESQASEGAHLSTLFYVSSGTYKGLYLIGGGLRISGTNKLGSNLIIRKSTNIGVDWSDPVVLRTTPGWVLSSSAMADYGDRRWLAIGATQVISIADDLDPMVAKNWIVSQPPQNAPQVTDTEEGTTREFYGGEVASWYSGTARASQLDWLAGKPHLNLRQTRMAEGWVAITDPKKIFPKYRSSNEHLWRWTGTYTSPSGGKMVLQAYESKSDVETVGAITLLSSQEFHMRHLMRNALQAQLTELYRGDRPGEAIPQIQNEEVVRERSDEGFTEGNAVAGPADSWAPGVWVLPKLSGQPYTARIKMDLGTQGSGTNGYQSAHVPPGEELPYTAAGFVPRHRSAAEPRADL